MHKRIRLDGSEQKDMELQRMRCEIAKDRWKLVKVSRLKESPHLSLQM